MSALGRGARRSDHQVARRLHLEYVDGVTLSHRLQRQALSLDQIYDICLQLAETIGIAHEHNIVHRDLKPDNIMLVKRGEQENYVKLLDFDLVKMEIFASKVHSTISQA